MWSLEGLGWSAARAEQFEPFTAQALVPARVAVVHKDMYGLYWPEGELWAEVSGRLRHHAASEAALPATGDWVAVRVRPSEGRATIHAVLPRQSRFSRKGAGSATAEQVVAANADRVFLVSGLDGDFNLRRLERGLVLAAESGASPVVVLNKADLCADPLGRRSPIATIAPGVAVHVVSSLTGEGLAELSPHLGPGLTVALVGSSGVGKSTLANRILGWDSQPIGEIRAHDSRGRHTTTRRELLPVPGGDWLNDTPGLRELPLWADEAALPAAFAEVDAAAARCRFRDCRHEREPGCAVQEALAEGRLARERFASFLKLRKEIRHLELRQDAWARQAEKRRVRSLHKLARRFSRD